MKKIGFKKKLFFFSFFLFIIFFSIEIFLRIANIEYPIFQKSDPLRGFSLIPNSSGTWRREGEGKIRINSDGLRDIEHQLKKPVNTLRIAILGDSFAEARSINLEDTFWFKLKDNLKKCKNFHNGKKIEVINFGVSEYGTTQQYLTLKNNVWKYDPDLILLAFYSGNDVSDNLKELSTKKYRPYFKFIDNKLVEIDESFLYSKPYKILNSIPGKIFIKISQYSRISQLFREVYVQQYFKKQRNKKNNNFGNQLVINSSNLYNPSGENWSKAWSITENIILLINNEIEKNKKKFILVTLSNPIQVDLDLNKSNNFTKLNNIEDIFYPENRLENFSKKNSINFIQISKRMREIAIKDKVYFHGFNNSKLGEGHWNIEGHDLASKLISNDICNLN